VLTKTNIENARVILSYCHTSENTIYCRFVHIAETVKKKSKLQCCKSQNITRNMQQYLFYLY